MFGPWNRKYFNVILVGRSEESFWLVQILLLFQVKKRLNETNSGDFAFVRYFDLSPTIDNTNQNLNYLCLGWAAEDEVENPYWENKSSDEQIELENWFFDIIFVSVMSGKTVEKKKILCISVYRRTLRAIPSSEI